MSGKTPLAQDLFVLMLLQIRDRLDHQHHVLRRGERSVDGSGAAHVDEPLLKRHDGAAGYDGRPVQHERPPLAAASLDRKSVV